MTENENREFRKFVAVHREEAAARNRNRLTEISMLTEENSKEIDKIAGIEEDAA
jgi:hypothetical protein